MIHPRRYRDVPTNLSVTTSPLHFLSPSLFAPPRGASMRGSRILTFRSPSLPFRRTGGVIYSALLTAAKYREETIDLFTIGVHTRPVIGRNVIAIIRVNARHASEINSVVTSRVISKGRRSPAEGKKEKEKTRWRRDKEDARGAFHGGRFSRPESVSEISALRGGRVEDRVSSSCFLGATALFARNSHLGDRRRHVLSR